MKTKPCHEMRGMIYPYIDERLSPEEREELEEHLGSCAGCRESVYREVIFRKRFIQPLKGLECPEEVRERVHSALDQKRRSRLFGRGNPLFNRMVGLALAGCAFIVISFFTVSYMARPDLHAIADASVEQHERFMRGRLPLENYDWSKSGVENWFRRKVDFSVTLPNLKDEDLSIVGGRLSHLRELDSAYIIFEYEGDYVSLFCFRGDRLRWAGGKEQKVGDNTFYHFQQDDSHIVLWKQGDLGYALVSHRGEVPWSDMAMDFTSFKRAS